MANRIRELREQRGISQRKLGSMIGRDGQFIYRLENGDTRLKFADLPALGRALGVEWAEIVGVASISEDERSILEAY